MRNAATIISPFRWYSAALILSIGLCCLVPLPLAKASGDANGDGRDDVLWRNFATGENVMWLMDGLAVIGADFLPTVTDTRWNIEGSGDYNGDSRADILWRDDSNSGQNVMWLMDGFTVVRASFLPTVDVDWDMVGSDD